VLRLQSHLLKVKVLTDPLKLLFRLILQKVSVIPLYALLAIGNFYYNLDKLDEALEVYTAALGKANYHESPMFYTISEIYCPNNANMWKRKTTTARHF
jgi:hypothetical protein